MKISKSFKIYIHIILLYLISHNLYGAEDFSKNIVIHEKPTQIKELKFKDSDLNDVDLTNKKGNIMILNFWATWCAPCKREIPYLQKLENDFHDNQISFVSISVDQNKTAWENMVKSKGLKGIQLYAPPQQAQTFKDQYLISGIPRFILLDKEGKIINANAPRPSGNIRDIISKLKGI